MLLLFFLGFLLSQCAPWTVRTNSLSPNKFIFHDSKTAEKTHAKCEYPAGNLPSVGRILDENVFTQD